MVHLSMINFVRKNGYDKVWKRLKIFRMTAKYYGRKRNCYKIAHNFLTKALNYTTVGRKVKPRYLDRLRRTRLEAACDEHDTDYLTLTKNLIKCDIQLDNTALVNLAIWEPRSFKSLTEIARAKAEIEAPQEVKPRLTVPEGVITRGML